MSDNMINLEQRRRAAQQEHVDQGAKREELMRQLELARTQLQQIDSLSAGDSLGGHYPAVDVREDRERVSAEITKLQDELRELGD